MARGISWPFRIEAGEFPRGSEDDRQIAESLTTLLQTRKGERVMAPDYGINSDRYVFETNNAIMAEGLRFEVATAILKYEQRVIAKNIKINQSESTLTLTVEYVVKATRQDRDITVQFRRN